MLRPFIVTTAAVLVLAGCGSGIGGSSCRKTRTPEKVTVTRGVWGNVNFSQGNLMPSNTCSGSITPVQREVRIHALAGPSDVVADPSSPVFFTAVNTALIATVTSDSSGFFQAAVDAGSYSVFVVERGKLFANVSDGAGNLSPVTVADAPVEVPIDINDQATY